MKIYNLLDKGYKECFSDLDELTNSVEFGSEHYEFLCNLYYILSRLVCADTELHLVLAIRSNFAFVDVEPKNGSLAISAGDRAMKLDFI